MTLQKNTAVPRYGQAATDQDAMIGGLLERKLAQEVRLVRLLDKIASVAHDATDSVEALTNCLSAVCSHLGCPIGHVYFVERSVSKLVSRAAWYDEDQGRFREFREMTVDAEFKKGSGLPGAAWESGTLVIWTKQLRDPAHFLRSDVALESGLVSGIAIPIVTDEGIVAVMELFSPDTIEPDETIRSISSAVRMQMGRVFEKVRIRELQKDLANGAKMIALGEMAGGIAHEINSPLQVIMLEAEGMLAESETGIPDPQFQSARAARVLATCDRISKIVKGLTAFAREGRNDPLMETPVGRIIDETLSFCSGKLRRMGIEIVVEPLEESVSVHCRSHQISQVLLNLLNNARDAIAGLPERWIRISVRDEGARVSISVTDSGRGIPEKVRSRIFDPYFTTKEPGRGTGLGLSICRTIIAAHHGSIQVDSSSANTRFVIELPKRQGSVP